MDTKIQLQNLQTLFSKFKTLANQIDVLQQQYSDISANGSSIGNGNNGDGARCDNYDSVNGPGAQQCLSSGSSIPQSDIRHSGPTSGSLKPQYDVRQSTCSNGSYMPKFDIRYSGSSGGDNGACSDDLYLPNGPDAKQCSGSGSSMPQYNIQYSGSSGGSSMPQFDIRYSRGSGSHDGSCFDATDLFKTNQVMGITIPSNNTFNGSRLEQVLSKEIDVVDVVESDVEDDIVDVGGLEPDVESSDFAVGSNDNTAVLNTKIITESTLKSRVNAGSSNVSDSLVVSENLMKSKHPSPPEEKNFIPRKINIQLHHGCDDVNMFVPASGSNAKQYCCVYCNGRYSKLVRHLQTVHKNEPDVMKFQAKPTGSKERRLIIDMIRKRGQFKWNTDASLNGGELSTSRRPKFQKEAKGYETCANCYGSFTEKVLRPHWNKCSNNSIKRERIVKELSYAAEGRVHPDASDDLRNIIFPKMRQNDYVRLIRFDWLVIEFGNDLCLNYYPIYQHGLIRKKLRDAGKMLAAAKSISAQITDFSSLFQVKNCNLVVDAVRKVSSFDFKAKSFKSPGTASTLVTLINTVGELLIIEKMKQDDEIGERNVERFLKVFKKDSKNKINRLVGVQQSETKRRRNEDIPTTRDVKQLKTYLDCERDKCFDELSQKYSYEKWKYLSELTLASILVFNRRRTGEMRNITVADFHGRQLIDDQSDKLKTVPKSIRKVISSRMKIRGKLNRTVPVLLKHSFDKCLQLLLLHRRNAGITAENEYIFALPTESGNVKVIDSCNVMRTLSNRCNAENPGSLRGTKLRKHMASVCSTLELKDNDVTNVANFMGHDDQIHRNIYRHNPLEREVVQMCQLLEVAQNLTSEESNSETSDDEEQFVTKKTMAGRKNIRAKTVATSKIRKRISPVLKRKNIKGRIGVGTNRNRQASVRKQQKIKIAIDDDTSGESSAESCGNEKQVVPRITNAVACKRVSTVRKQKKVGKAIAPATSEESGAEYCDETEDITIRKTSAGFKNRSETAAYQNRKRKLPVNHVTSEESSAESYGDEAGVITKKQSAGRKNNGAHKVRTQNNRLVRKRQKIKGPIFGKSEQSSAESCNEEEFVTGKTSSSSKKGTAEKVAIQNRKGNLPVPKEKKEELRK